MGTFASNAIGSHPAPLRATLFKKKSKYLFRNLFFGTRSQKGNFKPFPTKWYTLSLFQSHMRGHHMMHMCMCMCMHDAHVCLGQSRAASVCVCAHIAGTGVRAGRGTGGESERKRTTEVETGVWREQCQ